MLNHSRLLLQYVEARAAVRAFMRQKTGNKSTVLPIIRQYQLLREQCKFELYVTSALNLSFRKGQNAPWICDELSLLFCKTALNHISINLTLLELCPVLENEARNNNNNNLETEILALFELIQTGSHRAQKNNPLQYGRLRTIYHTICSQMMSNPGCHSIWNKIYQMFGFCPNTVTAFIPS